MNYWFTAPDQAGRANLDHVDHFDISHTSGFYGVSAAFIGGSNWYIANGLATEAAALAVIDGIISVSILEGS